MMWAIKFPKSSAGSPGREGQIDKEEPRDALTITSA